MNLKRLAVYGGFVLVSGGCASDRMLAPPQAAAPTAVTFRGPASATVAEPVPLVLVNGVVTPTSSLREIAADDILDIEILKGGAAVQRYGERGANGVILIRTKSAGT